MHGSDSGKMNIEEGIRRVYPGPHLVVLGAGASIASTCRNPEVGGKQLPSMDNFVQVVGIADLIEAMSEKIGSKNFELIYSRLHEADPNSNILRQMEERIEAYFSSLRLPPTPTIYDYLVLSLRRKDLIATFNWDPFLYDACRRHHLFTKLPRVVYLHGNVRIGYCAKHNINGLNGTNCSKCSVPFRPTKLLYPIMQKNYTSDSFLSIQWKTLQWFLRHAKLFTIFGYGAPESDVEAVDIMSDAWGSSNRRNLDQIEVIDIVSEDEIRDRWERFIHTHHYEHTDNYFQSRLAMVPRRTFESYKHQFLFESEEESLQEPNWIPDQFETLDQLKGWFKPLIEAEAESGF